MELQDILNPWHNVQETILDRSNARALVNWVEVEAMRVGLPEMPVLLHIKHELCNAGAAVVKIDGRDKPMILVTEGFTKHICGSPDLNTHMPEAMKGIFAHEISHLKDISSGIDSIKLRKIPLFALPVLSVIGYELYSRARLRHKEDTSKTVRQHLSDVTVEEKQASLQRDEQRYREYEKPAIQWGHRVAALGGGLLGGGLVAGQMSVSAEFRADRAAIVASGCSPETFVETLDKVMATNEKILLPQLQEWGQTIRQRSFMDNIKQAWELAKHGFVETTYMKHPTNPQRLKALQSFVAKGGAAIAHGI